MMQLTKFLSLLLIFSLLTGPVRGDAWKNERDYVHSSQNLRFPSTEAIENAELGALTGTAIGGAAHQNIGKSALSGAFAGLAETIAENLPSTIDCISLDEV